MNLRGGRPAVLLDRDGTLNENRTTYVTRIEDLVPIPGAFEAVGRLCRAGWAVAVCTNQACIGKGIATQEDVVRVHDECSRLAERYGGRIEGFYVCPHRPDEGCVCRKPKPGLLVEAARVHGYDLTRSYYAGDARRDLEAALAANTEPVFLRSGGATDELAAGLTSLVFDDLAAAADWILARRAAASGA